MSCSASTKWTRRRLRAVAWTYWKHGRTRFAALRRRGVSKSLAAKTASGPARHNLRTRTWVTARNHRRITAPRTRTFNHGAALDSLNERDLYS